MATVAPHCIQSAKNIIIEKATARLKTGWPFRSPSSQVAFFKEALRSLEFSSISPPKEYKIPSVAIITSLAGKLAMTATVIFQS